MIKLKLKYIKIFTVIILVVIIINQALWTHNMYVIHQSELLTSINKSIETAIKKELSDRNEQLGGWIGFAPLTDSRDTTRFITKTVRSIDTSFQVTLDRFDPNSTDKLIQFLIKDDLPVNVYKLDSLFRIELINERYPNLNTRIDYIDLKSDYVLSSRVDYSLSESYLSSELFYIDIFNNYGVKAYVQNPTFSILRLMIFQLILSIILIIISTIFLFLLVKTILWQKKEEKMRQESINAMTHEFRRPISTAVAQAALIPYYLQKEKEEKIEEYAHSIMLELNKLTAYTERIQQLSNDSKENINLNKIIIELHPFFDLQIEKYTETKEKPVSFDLKIFTFQKYIYADLLHFSNIIENLIENAIKYSNDFVHIVITIEDEKEKLKIRIKDNGLGISKLDQSLIFEKYYRSKNRDVQKSVGFGLGLTYVKSLVEAHNGQISLNSELNQGSEFILYFPTNKL